MTREQRRPGAIVAMAAAGQGSQDERRLRLLLEGLPHAVVPIDRSRGRLRLILSMVTVMWRRRTDLVVIEGTGMVAGIPAIVVNVATGGRSRYLVGSGDAVGPYVAMKAGWAAGMLAGWYERVLYRRCFAFIGWTPHFVGRALQLGAPRGVTIPGFPVIDPGAPDPASRERLRREWDAGDSEFVVGLVGSINSPNKDGYGYGTELVGVAGLLGDEHYRFVIVGDGPGLEALRSSAAGDARFVFTGRVAAEEVPGHLRAFDASVISQTHDLVGGLRWTTKLPELLACGVPTVVSGTPALLDLVTGADDGLVHVVAEATPGGSDHLRGIADELERLRRTSGDGGPRRSTDPWGLVTAAAARYRFRRSLEVWGAVSTSLASDEPVESSTHPEQG